MAAINQREMIAEITDPARSEESAAPRSAIGLRLIGGFEIDSVDGTPPALPTQKCKLLLSYLALTPGQSHPRSKLAALFWEDRGEEQARGSLRNALSAIRAAFGEDAVVTDRETVCLRRNLFATDLDRLDALARADGAGASAGELGAFAGVLLDGADAQGAALEEWLGFERTRCRNLAQRLMQGVAKRLLAEGAHGEALAVALQLVGLDPLREHSHRLVMRIHAANGERSLALAQFRACAELLNRELGVLPSPETAALARAIAADAGCGTEVPAPAALLDPPPGRTATPRRAPDYNLSIAVLPFSADGRDPDQTFLAEGLAEDIITELSRQKEFLVIARQSSFPFGPAREGATDAAESLRVRYVLVGKVRRAGDRLRINVQLVDASGDRSVWAERFDRRVSEMFEIQSEIVETIIATVDAQVRLAERERAARKLPRTMDAWEFFHRGLWHTYHFTPEQLDMADTFFQRAVDDAPDFALPHAGLAYTAFARVTWQMTRAVDAHLERALVRARTAVALDGANAFCQVVLGRVLTVRGEVNAALDHLRLARDLSPSFALAYFALGQGLIWAGRPAEALPCVERALRLNPRDPLACLFLALKAFCHYFLGEFEAAEQAASAAMDHQARESWSRLARAASLAALGRTEEARTTIVEAQKLAPGLTLAGFDAVVGRAAPEVLERLYADLRRAGFA